MTNKRSSGINLRSHKLPSPDQTSGNQINMTPHVCLYNCPSIPRPPLLLFPAAISLSFYPLHTPSPAGIIHNQLITASFISAVERFLKHTVTTFSSTRIHFYCICNHFSEPWCQSAPWFDLIWTEKGLVIWIVGKLTQTFYYYFILGGRAKICWLSVQENKRKEWRQRG